MNEENEVKVEEEAAQDITGTVVDEDKNKSTETGVQVEKVEAEAKDETQKTGEQLATPKTEVEFETETPQPEIGIAEVKNELGSSKMEAGYQSKMEAGYQPKMEAGYQPKMEAGYQPKMEAGYQPKDYIHMMDSSSLGSVDIDTVKSILDDVILT